MQCVATASERLAAEMNKPVARPDMLTATFARATCSGEQSAFTAMTAAAGKQPACGCEGFSQTAAITIQEDHRFRGSGVSLAANGNQSLCGSRFLELGSTRPKFAARMLFWHPVTSGVRPRGGTRW